MEEVEIIVPVVAAMVAAILVQTLVVQMVQMAEVELMIMV